MSSYYSAGTYPVSGTVLNAFNSVSPLISQRNYNKTYTRILFYQWGNRVGDGGEVGDGIILVK